jgi:hypothetical protein
MGTAMGNRDYLKLASECLQMAQQAKDSLHRTTMLDIASKWLLLAGESADARAVLDLVEAMKQSPESYRVRPQEPAPR